MAATAPPSPAPPAAPSAGVRRSAVLDRRARSGSQTLLSNKSPTVTLTRIQSGVGTLHFEAACSPAVGDLRLGCAYQLRDGHCSTAQHTDGSRFGPRDSKRPVIMTSRAQFEEITLDLAQSREVERVLIYAFSESGQPLNWGGTFVVTTLGGAHIDLPLEIPISQPEVAGTLAVLSLYNVLGEFVLRAEMELIAGPIRDVCRAYGYDRITWLDERTPVE